MNLALSDEQELLREAARGTLARVKTIEAARDALEDESKRPDLWPTAVEAGWPGLLISERHGGAELGAFDAMLVAEECGRVLAPVPLLGLLPATSILDAAGHESLPAVAAGELRPVYVPARPPSDLRAALDGASRAPARAAPRRRGLGVDGDAVVLDGAVCVRARSARRGAAGGGRGDRRRASRSRSRVGPDARRRRDRVAVAL